MSQEIVFRSEDPDAVEIVNPAAAAPLLIIVEHAGNAVPAAMNGLGLSPPDLQRHIAWDIGAAGLARRLAESMNATAVLARYSRLLIDLNRPLGDPECVPASSDGTVVPANAGLSYADVRTRADAFYWPYHRAVDEQIGRLRLAGQVPAVLSLHTFTPAMQNGAAPGRPWHVGVLYSRDERLPRPLMEALRAEDGLVVGDNEPYSGVTHGYTLKVHGLAHGLPHAELEIRQDLVEEADGQAHWADLLTRVLASLLDRPEMKDIVHI